MATRVPPQASALPQTEPLSLPRRKPVVRADRIPLFERKVSIRLSPAAMDLLLDHAAVVSEGELDDGIFGGSTMMTIDLTRLSSLLSEPCDLATAQKLESLLTGDATLRQRVRAMALHAAELRAGGPLDDVAMDVRCSRDGRHFHIDIDVEGIPKELP